MTDSLRGRCELLVENQKIMRKSFKFEDSAIPPICASLYAAERAILNPSKILYCKKLIKSKTSAFSSFRSVTIMPMATMLSLDQDMHDQLTNTLNVYASLRNEFAASVYLPIVAYTMAKYSHSAAVRARRTKELYKSTRSRHPFIVSSDDVVYAALLAARGFSDNDIEEAYQKGLATLKSRFYRNSIQTIASILLLGSGATEENFVRVKSIYESLREKGYKYGKTYEAAILTALALTDANEEVIAEQIIEVNDYLKDHRGFNWVMGQRLRLMHSALIVCQEYSSAEKALAYSSAINGVTSMIIAQQAAISASVSATAISVSNSITT